MPCNYIALPFQNWHDKILDVIDDILFVITEETEYPNNYVFNKDILDRIDMLITWLNDDEPVAFAKQYSFCGDIRIRLDWIITHFSETIPTETVTQKQFIARLDVICDILTAGDFGVSFAPDTAWMATQNITISDNHVTFPTTRVFTVSVNPGCLHPGTSDSLFPFSCETMLRLEYIYKGLVNVVVPTSITLDVNSSENANVGTNIVIKAYVNPSNSTIKDVDYTLENENITFLSKTSEHVGANLIYTFTFYADTNANNEGVTDITFKAVGDETVTETVEYTLIQLPTSIVLDKTATENCRVGEVVTVKAYVLPDLSTNKEITVSLINTNFELDSTTVAVEDGHTVYTFSFFVAAMVNNTCTLIFTATGDNTITSQIAYTIGIAQFKTTWITTADNEEIVLPFVGTAPATDTLVYLDSDNTLLATIAANTDLGNTNGVTITIPVKGNNTIRIENAANEMPKFNFDLVNASKGKIKSVDSALLKEFNLTEAGLYYWYKFNKCYNLAVVYNLLYRLQKTYLRIRANHNNNTNLLLNDLFTFRFNNTIFIFSEVFVLCISIKLHSNIFCNELTEKETRFVNLDNLTFDTCFFRTSANASANGGTAPELWNYYYGETLTLVGDTTNINVGDKLTDKITGATCYVYAKIGGSTTTLKIWKLKYGNLEAATYKNFVAGNVVQVNDVDTANTFGSITGSPIKTSCFGGNGNNTTTLTNYNDIPYEWRT